MTAKEFLKSKKINVYLTEEDGKELESTIGKPVDIFKLMEEFSELKQKEVNQD